MSIFYLTLLSIIFILHYLTESVIFAILQKNRKMFKKMIPFIITSLLLGIGLAMDAFSVSIADGLNEPKMKQSKMLFIAFLFAFMQALMPLIGYLCIHVLVEKFTIFTKITPVIALLLLSYIGGKMLIEHFKKETEEIEKINNLTLATLLIQGIATSIDALSVGFTIASYNTKDAILCSIIIAVATFIISYVGVLIGKKAQSKLSKYANLIGGIILVGIGLEIFISSFF